MDDLLPIKDLEIIKEEIEKRLHVKATYWIDFKTYNYYLRPNDTKIYFKYFIPIEIFKTLTHTEIAITIVEQFKNEIIEHFKKEV
jgi:hypothetical protein